MKPCKITAMKIACHKELSKLYELPQKIPCNVSEGDVFVSYDATKPNGFCEEAWQTLYPFVKRLASGEEKIFGDWMKNPASAMVSCNDGFRPVSFYIEVIEN